MRFVERQARLEKRTYEAIDELEDIFDVEVHNYPEVRWLGRKGHFEDLGLQEYYREDVEGFQKAGWCVFIHKPNMIILNSEDPSLFCEEAAHFVHLHASNIRSHNKNKEDYFAANALMEMFGYLGSKILNVSRKNPYRAYPDYFALAEARGVAFIQAMKPIQELDSEGVAEMLIHSQGYGLAERVFYALQTGQTNMDYFQKLIRQSLSKSGQATKTFKELRQEFWPV